MAELKPRGTSEEVGAAVRDVFGSKRDRGKPPWFTGVLVENVRFEQNSDKDVYHKLGRKPRGFIIVSARLVDSTAQPTHACDLSMRSCDNARATMRYTDNQAVPRIYSLWFW